MANTTGSDLRVNFTKIEKKLFYLIISLLLLIEALLLAVSYSNALYFFIGLLLGLITCFLYSKKLKCLLNKQVTLKIWQQLIFIGSSSILFLLALLAFLLAILLSPSYEVQYYGIDKAYETQIVRDYEAVITPLDSSLNSFKLIERIHPNPFALDHAASKVGLQGGIQGSGSKAEIAAKNTARSLLTYENTIIAKNIGFFLKELNFEPLKANNNSYATVQLSQDASYTIQSLCESLPDNFTCARQGYDYCCPIAHVKLLEFPKGLFYGAYDDDNFDVNDYLDRQTIQWENKQYFDHGGIKFAFISPKFYQIKDFIKILLNLYSVDRWIILLSGVVISILIFSNLKPKPIIKKEVTVSGNNYDQSHTTIQSGSFGIGNIIGGEINADTIAGNINETQSRDLLEIASEIKLLLEELSKNYPTTTTNEKIMLVAEAAKRIEKSSILKTRVINALKMGGVESFKEAVNHRLINMLVPIVEGWID